MLSLSPLLSPVFEALKCMNQIGYEILYSYGNNTFYLNYTHLLLVIVWKNGFFPTAKLFHSFKSSVWCCVSCFSIRENVFQWVCSRTGTCLRWVINGIGFIWFLISSPCTTSLSLFIMQWILFSFSGVASTNLKIYPDVFMSLDGGLGWSRVSFSLHTF